VKKPPGKRPADGRGRALTSDEADLWQQVTRTTQPVAGKSRVKADAAREPSLAAPAAAPRAVRLSAAKPQSPEPVSPETPRARKPPPIAEFDRRKVRHIASGRTGIDARLDLHGARQRDARQQLRAFLLSAHAKGLRTVLVITGKGSDVPDDPLGRALGEPARGVLRRSVPQWLDEPDLRALIISFTTAGVRHGGEGALYIRLRRAERIRSD
jgi:DNA-nicking Smr family endonuclease